MVAVDCCGTEESRNPSLVIAGSTTWRRSCLPGTVFPAEPYFGGRFMSEAAGDPASDRKVLLDDAERMRLLEDNVRDYAIFSLDPDGNVASWNIGAQRILGYTEAE